MPTASEVHEAHRTFLVLLGALLQRQGLEVKVRDNGSGLWVCDDPAGGWAYFVEVRPLAVVNNPPATP